MSEFPPNLDDGELWLPSEIFPDVGVGCHHHLEPGVAGLSYLDDLAEKLGAFGLLDRGHLLRPNDHHSDGFRFGNGSVSRLGPSVQWETGAGMEHDGFRSRAAAKLVLGVTAAASRSVVPSYAEKPPQGRSGVTARQQQVPIRGRRFVPVRTGGSGRECGGTGVFLPRVSCNEVVAPTKNRSDMRNGGGRRKQTSRNAAMGKQVMPLRRGAPPEMYLPQDWTY